MRLAKISAKHTRHNKTELLKASRSYKQAWEALQTYAQEGFESIYKEDLDFFLKCLGIYHRPATPGKFMMRVRVPGGRLSARQAHTLGRLARDYGNDFMDLTTRMQVQLRHLEIAHIPTIMEELEAVGLTSWQTGVDNLRNIVSDPLDGLAFDSLIETAPLVEKLQALWLKNPEWIATLPRKFNTAVGGTMTNRCNLFAHDCCFALANKDGEYGFNVYLGGKVGAVARSADIFLLSKELPAFYEALLRTYRRYGFRDSRNKNRLHYLIKEAGMTALVEAVQAEAGRRFAPAGETLVKQPRTEERDGRIRLKDGSFALHMVVPSGLFSGTAMMETARLAQSHGTGALRVTTTQNLLILGVAQTRLADALRQKPFERYANVASPYLNQTVACAGNAFCPFGVIPTKPDAIAMAEYLHKEVPLPSDALIRLHWSGCVKGCGVHGLGDIGFVGCKAKEAGQTVHGVHILLGGKSVNTQQEAYTLLKSVPLSRAKYPVAELARAYRDLRQRGESFEAFESRVLRRYSKGALGFWVRYNAFIAHPRDLPKLSLTADWPSVSEHNEIFLLGQQLYKALTGQNPYQGTHLFNPLDTEPAKAPRLINPAVPEKLSQTVLKMVAPSPRRYEVFSEIVYEWEAL
ncbi:MAG: ferredoxin--nitrite reductase [Epsilonproteobacteria bacterium]|nr:ferredoxin--nitrite reductase [Campylobacterota bacterium]